MEQKMETTELYHGIYIYRHTGYIGIMEKKMKSTIWGLGFRNASLRRSRTDS